MGAALAWVVSRLVLRGLSVWRIQRATGIRSVGSEAWVAIALTLVAYGPIAIATHVWGLGDVESLVFVAVFGSVAYIIGVWGFGDRLALSSFMASIRRS